MSTPTPAEARWLADNPRAPNPHPMRYAEAKLTVHRDWADGGEMCVMARLHALITGKPASEVVGEAPFGPRSTGYRWQLDTSNDWWAQLDTQPHEPGWPLGDRHVLTIVHRYSPQKAWALAEWAAVVFRGKVQRPQVWSHVLARQGGEWVGAARRWMQTRFRNGSDVTWGSNDILQGAPVTVADIEEVAACAAAAAINERNAGRL